MNFLIRWGISDWLQASGVTRMMVGYLAVLEGLPRSVIALVVGLLVATITEVTSNTAVSTIVLPIMADLVSHTSHQLFIIISSFFYSPDFTVYVQ